MKKAKKEIKVIALDQNGNPLTPEQKTELGFKIIKAFLELAYPGVVVTKKQTAKQTAS